MCEMVLGILCLLFCRMFQVHPITKKVNLTFLNIVSPPNQKINLDHQLSGAWSFCGRYFWEYFSLSKWLRTGVGITFEFTVACELSLLISSFGCLLIITHTLLYLILKGYTNSQGSVKLLFLPLHIIVWGPHERNKQA